MEPGFLENEAEKVPIFVCQDSDFHIVFIEDEQSSDSISDRSPDNQDVTSDRTLVVDHHEEGNQQSQLKITFDIVTPEEAASVRCVEVRIDVADQKKVGPPVLVAI